MRTLCYLPALATPALNDLSVAIRAAGSDFTACKTEKQVFEHMTGSVVERRNVLITDQGQSHLIREFSERYPATLIILAIDTPLLQMDPDLRFCLPIHSFIAYANNELDPCDFHTLFRKLKTKDIFGVEKYLKQGTEFQSAEIFSPRDKGVVIERVEDSIRYLGGYTDGSRFHQYGQRIAQMLDELIINAVFGANPRYTDADRGTEFKLSPVDSLRVEWGFDGETFGLSVRDQFGHLTKETVLRYLDNTLDLGDISQRKSGGLGFRCIFDRLQKFVVNVNPDFLTEVVCLLHFDRRIRDFDARPKSFHYFTL